MKLHQLFSILIVLAMPCVGTQAALAFDPSPVGGSPRAIEVQVDGKIVLGGFFTQLGGQAQEKVARLHPDGSLDATFSSPPTFGPPGTGAYALAVQPDGKIVVTGDFLQIGGISRRRVARLNVDGSVDETFANPSVGWSFRGIAVALQSDGKILLGGLGTFTDDAHSRIGVVRLNADGTVDSTFNAHVFRQSLPQVDAIAIQPNGGIVMGGSFTSVGGVVRSNMARVDSNGVLDMSFDPNPSGTIRALVLLNDGRIVVGGGFAQIAGVQRNRFAQLNGDGSIDATFEPVSGGVDSTVHRLAVQSDGKVLLGGFFRSIATEGGPVPRILLARVHPNGSLDTEFDAALTPELTEGGTIEGLALQLDGKILISGNFSHVAGVQRRLARLHPDGTLDDGGPAELLVDPNPVAFGEVTVGEESPRTITLTNTGLSPLLLQGLIQPAAPFFGENLAASDCGTQGLTLEPTESCTIELRCAPVSEGVFNGTLGIESDAPGSPYELPLSCEGTAAQVPQLSVTPSTVTFSPPVPIGTPSTVRTVTLASVGSAPVEIDAIDEAQVPFARVGGNCPATPFSLAPTESCTLDFQFTPIEPDIATQMLEISSNAGVSTLQLAGMGQAVPKLEAAPSTVDFGEIEVDDLAAAQTVTLTSSGSADVTVTGIASAASPFARTGGTCTGTPFTLTPSQSCTLVYRFGPTAVGEFSQLVTVDNNAGALDIELLGEGVQTTVPPHITLDPGTVDIQLQSGDTTAQPLLIGNDGEDDLVWSLRIDGRAAPAGLPACELPAWLDLDPAGGTVTGGENGEAEILIDATALAAGTYDAALCFESNDPDQPLVTLPVNLQVTPAGDEIHGDRFEAGSP